MKKYTIRGFCADQIDVITNFAVHTNVDLKRVHCTSLGPSYDGTRKPSLTHSLKKPELQKPLWKKGHNAEAQSVKTMEKLSEKHKR